MLHLLSFLFFSFLFLFLFSFLFFSFLFFSFLFFSFLFFSFIFFSFSCSISFFFLPLLCFLLFIYLGACLHATRCFGCSGPPIHGLSLHATMWECWQQPFVGATTIQDSGSDWLMGESLSFDS